MVTEKRHTGLVVRDLETSLRFYRDLLGLTVWKQAVEEGAFIQRVVGLDSVRLAWVKLKAPNGGIIELLQYLSPIQTFCKNNVNNVGFSHVAFTVMDINETYQRLMAAGHVCINPPTPSPDGSVRVLYCRDPDGIVVELVEELKR